MPLQYIFFLLIQFCSDNMGLLPVPQVVPLSHVSRFHRLCPSRELVFPLPSLGKLLSVLQTQPALLLSG